MGNQMIQELRQDKQTMKEKHITDLQSKEQEVKERWAKRFRNDGKTITVNKYVGQLNMLNQPHGKGVITIDDGFIYDGDWKNGKMEGHGAMKYLNGDKYDGEWKNFKKEGRGAMKYANGREYIGDWKNGKRHGKGVYKDKKGELLYEGEWVDDKQQKSTSSH